MLKPLRTKRRWARLKTYDLEWNPYTMKVRCGVVFDGVRHYWYKTAEELLRYQLTAENSGAVFYAHNGGRADFSYLLKYLKGKGYQVSASFSNSSANIVSIRRGNLHWRFVDSLWLFASTLRKIGKAIGYEKGGPPIEDYDGDDPVAYRKMVMDWYANVPLAELVDYCKRDCEILWKAIAAFQSELWGMGGELKCTIASTAMSLFRRRYLGETIKTNAHVNKVCRESYAASRVEVLRRHIDHGWYFDINSSFPFSMTKPQPGALKRMHNGYLPDVLGDEVPLVLAECAVEVPDLELPPLALRFDHKVFYPTGRWRSWFTGVDLRALVERGGRIIKCYRSYSFYPFDRLQSYVHDIYGRRMAAKAAGNDFKQMVYKILLNSLYGKFAEGRDKTELIMNPTEQQVYDRYLWHPEDPELLKDWPSREPYPGIWTTDHQVKVPHEHVPVASSVTAFSRLLLLEHMERSTELGGHSYYCDTDGFATDVEHPTSAELGGLKAELEFHHGDFHAPKTYGLTSTERHEDGSNKRRCKAKGFPLPEPRKVREKQYDALVGSAYSPGNAGIEIERMLRPQEMLKRRKSLDPESVKMMKRLYLSDRKRHMYATGVSRPFHVKEIAPDLAL